MQVPIRVQSEVGRLKTVLLHRPGTELENLMPDYLARQLFDDIPYLVHAREEHDQFAQTLRDCGVEVLYLEDLVKTAIERGNAREELIWEYIREADISAAGAEQAVNEYLSNLSVDELIDVMAGGVRKSQIGRVDRSHLVDYMDEAYPFYVDPLPNLYFTRDPFACVGNGVLICHMNTVLRRRETLFAKYIFKYHPVYKWAPRWHDRTDVHSVEGGDIAVLNRETVVIGLSERTSPQAAELIANRILSDKTDFRRVIAIDIPKVRAFMHLDTVMTMVDEDKFVIHPNIQNDMRCFSLTKPDGKLCIREETKPLDEVLADAVGRPVTLIRCGGGSIIDAAREQWNDGANTLAVAPGEVITYSRNYVTNRILRENGLTVHEIPSSELSRGRGGPRCMSMPFVREPIEK